MRRDPPDPATLALARAAMVSEQIEARWITDPAVLAAMRTVPRHEFVPPGLATRAYDDEPLPLERGQTISQPYIVAAMTAFAHVRPGTRALDVGTGSGYQAAILAAIGAEVYSIEIDAVLAEHAAATLARLGYGAVHLRTGDGYHGWPEAAPFDAILVAAAPPTVPRPLLDQLAVGGRMVIPIGDFFQELVVFTRETADRITRRDVFPVRFVPMTGAAGGRD